VLFNACQASLMPVGLSVVLQWNDAAEGTCRRRQGHPGLRPGAFSVLIRPWSCRRTGLHLFQREVDHDLLVDQGRVPMPCRPPTGDLDLARRYEARRLGKSSAYLAPRRSAPPERRRHGQPASSPTTSAVPTIRSGPVSAPEPYSSVFPRQLDLFEAGSGGGFLLGLPQSWFALL